MFRAEMRRISSAIGICDMCYDIGSTNGLPRQLGDEQSRRTEASRHTARDTTAALSVAAARRCGSGVARMALLA